MEKRIPEHGVTTETGSAMKPEEGLHRTFYIFSQKKYCKFFGVVYNREQLIKKQRESEKSDDEEKYSDDLLSESRRELRGGTGV